MAKKKSSIGFDPLAWMKDSRQSPESGRPSSVGTDDRRPRTEDSVISLGDSLTIADVAARHAEWKQTLAAGGPIEVDAGALKTVDTAALQLLAALARDFAFSWRGAPSEALRHGAGRLGLQTLLRLP